MLAAMIVFPAPATIRFTPDPVMLGRVAEPLTVRVLAPVLLLVQVWFAPRMTFALMVSVPALLFIVMPPVPICRVFKLLPLSPMVTLVVAALVKVRLLIWKSAARLLLRFAATGFVV